MADTKQKMPAMGIAKPARVKKRHVVLLISLILLVLAPFAVATYYLYTIASDQYASYVGFAVRKEETGSAVEVLGGITELTSSSSSDTDILYKFIKGRQMIRAIDEKIDLEKIYKNPTDFIFGLKDNPSIEDLEHYWDRMVKVFYDRNTGLIELRINAFAAEDARRIATAIVDESTHMINELSAIARNDTTRYSKEELKSAIDRLKLARSAITKFRAENQLIDPQADTAGRMSLLNSLQSQQAETLIELDMLRQTSNINDPRVVQSERRVQIIQNRIKEERQRIGGGENGDDTYSQLVGDYEALAVDLEFAEKSYLSALAAYDTAISEAQRQSRYLATYTPPTLAESPEYPQRIILLSMIFAGLALAWSVLILLFYSIRDRR